MSFHTAAEAEDANGPDQIAVGCPHFYNEEIGAQHASPGFAIQRFKISIVLVFEALDRPRSLSGSKSNHGIRYELNSAGAR